MSVYKGNTLISGSSRDEGIKDIPIASDDTIGGIKTSSKYLVTMDGSTNRLKALTVNADDYDSLSGSAFIGKGTLERVFTLKDFADKAYVDSHSGGGIPVLEPTADNPLDFNTLTEVGIYIIKNVTNTTALNHPGGLDLILIVHRSGTSAVRQLSTYGVWGIAKTREFNISTGVWSAWEYTKVPSGTFGGTMLANATSVATIGTAQVRNIYAGTADMTAGTTALTTGDIYFQYE